MCGRFAQTHPSDVMARLFAAAPANDLPEVPNFNTCPTTQIHVVYRNGAERRLVPMRWGFVPSWYPTPNDGPLLTNARAETLADKPAFRDACRSRRCLIPCTGFYEWHRSKDGSKQPWFVRPVAAGPMVFAGVWQSFEQNQQTKMSCAIVTTEAIGEMAQIHHRVPVILRPEDWGKWLGEAGHGAARLMLPPEPGALAIRRVSARVNSNRATGPALMEEVNDD